MECESNTQWNRVTALMSAHQSGQSAEDQATRERAECAAPVTVHPLAERSEFEDCEDPAGERPRRVDPAAEHPVTEGAEGRGGKQNAGPGKSGDDTADCQHEALADRVDRTVSRLLQGEKSFEELVQWVRRIGQAEMQ